MSAVVADKAVFLFVLPCYSGVIMAGLIRPVGGCGNTGTLVQQRAQSAAPRSVNASVCSRGWTRVAALTSPALFPRAARALYWGRC